MIATIYRVRRINSNGTEETRYVNTKTWANKLAKYFIQTYDPIRVSIAKLIVPMNNRQDLINCLNRSQFATDEQYIYVWRKAEEEQK